MSNYNGEEENNTVVKMKYNEREASKYSYAGKKGKTEKETLKTVKGKWSVIQVFVEAG